jgi:hypothetical protein
MTEKELAWVFDTTKMRERINLFLDPNVSDAIFLEDEE